MSNRFFWYDGDTTYDTEGQGTRLAGVNAPEADTATGSLARDASLLATTKGYQHTGLITKDKYGREVRQAADQDGNTLGQALVNNDMGSPMHGEMAHGISPHAAAARNLLGGSVQGIEADPAFQYLAEQSRAERLNAIDTYVRSGLDKQVLPTANDPLNERGIVDRAWDRGVDNMQGTFYGFANALGDVAGSDALAKWGEDGMAQNIWEAMASPATVETYEDIDGLADAGIYALEALVEFSPQLAMDASAALATGGGAALSRMALAGIGKSVLRKAGGEAAVAGARQIAASGLMTSPFATGARAGAFASMYAQNAGETQMNFALEGIDAPETALAIGAGKAALDYAGLSTVLNHTFKGLAKDSVTPDTVGQLLRNAGTAAGLAATAESVTEATQTLMDELAIMDFKPDHEINWTSVVDAAFKGGIAGGGVAGAGRAVTDALKMGAQSYDSLIPPADAGPQDTAPEPVRDIQAQIDSAPEGEGNWFTRENADDAKQIAAERGKAVKENADGSVFVGEQSLVDSLPENPTQTDIKNVVGYAQTKDEAMADPEGVATVETRSADGAVLRNQLVGKSIAEQVRLQQQQKFPEAAVEIKPIEEVMTEREQAVEQEQTQPKWEPQGKLAERDPAELVQLANERGIDPTRFQKTGLGEALIERVAGGLKANVPGNTQRRLDSLAPLAELLDMPAQELERSYYDSKNVIKGRDLLHQVFANRVQEKFGSAREFAAAIDALPLHQTRQIQQALGVKAEGGYDVASLVAEIEARAPFRTRSDMDAKPAEPTNGVFGDEDGTIEAARPPVAQPDAVHQAVFGTPKIRQVLADETGAVVTGDALEDRIEKMGRRERLQLEQMLANMDIDIGGKNRDAFLSLLEESIVEKAAYGIGKSRIDDATQDDAHELVQTVEGYDPSAMDSNDARLLQLIKATPLTDRAKDGWPAGMALYLDGMARIVKAGEPETKALSDEQSSQLHYARAVLTLARGLALAVPGMNHADVAQAVVDHFGITDALMTKAAGREAQALEALIKMADREDARVARSLAVQAVAKLDLGGTIEEDLEALAEALTDQPVPTIDMLTRDLKAMYGSDGIDRLALISAYEGRRGDDRQLTATSKGKDAGQGANNVAVDADAQYSDQAMSDSSFFGAVKRLSIRAWDMAVLPSAAQLNSIAFRDPLAQEVTRRFEGKNLLAIPVLEGSMFGQVTDAIGLARYAQASEHPPANVAEAASNLAENLARIMLGEQNSEREDTHGVAKGIVRTIPDDLVIFIDPDTGAGMTWGQAMNQWHEEGAAAEKLSALTRELDDTVDEANRLAEDLIEAYQTEVAERTAKGRERYPTMTEAFELWGKMLAGEQRWVDGRQVYYRKPARRADGGLTPLGSAVKAIGDTPIKNLGGQTLEAAYNHYLSLRGKTKELARERREAQQTMRRSSSFEQDELDQVARDLDLDLTTEAGLREAEEALRGGQGTRVTVEDQDNIDHVRGSRPFEDMEQEYDPSAHDPLAGLNVDDLLDGEDAAQDAAIRAWMESRNTHEQGEPHPFFRMESTVIGDKPEKGMAVEDVRRIAEAFKQAYKGNIPLDFRIEQTQEAVYGPLQYDEAGEPYIVKGAYHPTGGKRRDSSVSDVLSPGRMVLIAENHRDEADLLETLRHEILGHFGLNTFTPQVKRQVLDAILASKKVPGMRSIWTDIEQRYSDRSPDAQAEEVYAYVVERDPSAARPLRERVLAWLGMALRRMGLLKGKVTRAELETMAAQVSGAIRDGRARQRNWPQTDDASFRRAARAGQAAAQAKRFWSTGTSALAPVFSMVHSRIQRYSPELALMLFQPANKRAAKSGQSWEQRQRAIGDRMMGQVDKLLSELYTQAPGKSAQKRLAVQAAFEDAYSGTPQTDEGRQIRALVDALTAEAKRSGLQSVEFGAGFAPMAFDRQAISARQGEFEKLLAEKLKLEPRAVRDIVSNILDGPGVLEGVIAPGMPVGMHQHTVEIAEALGRDELIAQGWVLNRHEAALIHWVKGVSKRAAWEAIFGGVDTSRFEQRDGQVQPRFTPNGKFHEMLDQVRESHGEHAAQEILALVNGALGRHPSGQSMPGWWRTTQEFITGWVGMTVLAFSGIASIPELALPLVRAGGKVGIGQVVSDYAQAKKLARDMGVVISDASEQVVWQMTGEQYRSPLISKMQATFFKYNGNALIVKTSRILATGIGVRYLLHAAATNDAGSLSRLNIDAGTVHAWDQAGRPTWNPDLDPVTAEIASKVSDAVNQFVNEATLNPSKFQATHWGNNPWLKMIWHLKHFLYTYGDTVLGGMYREMRRRWKHLDPTEFAQAMAIAMPALIFGIAILPLAAASLELRDWIRRLNGQQGDEYQDALEYLGAAFTRSGGLGPLEFLFNMRQQQEWGKSVFGSIAPVPGKIDTLFSDASAAGKLRQMVPVWSQNKTLFGALE